MSTHLQDDDILSIELLSYDKPSETTDRFYFLEMSTLQATTLLPNDTKISALKIFAHTPDNISLDDHTIEGFKTIGIFNDFFLNNEDFYLADCDLELDHGLLVSSHDDGEVSITFISDKSNQQLIDAIFNKFYLKKSLLEIMKSKPGHYIKIDSNSNVIAEYKNFDEYIAKEVK